MKKIARIAQKVLPAVVSCLTLVLTINANSSSCFLINQPEEPESITKFKRFM